MHETKPITHCPYCEGTTITRKGTRKNKHGSIQLYFCNFCQKKFTPLLTKYHTFPLRVIIDVLSRYNRFATLDDARKSAGKKYGMTISATTARRWIEKFAPYLPFLRLRDRAKKPHNPRNAILERRLFHGQVYDFKYHRVKTQLLADEDPATKKNVLPPLMEYLENVPRKCPHELFREQNRRASQNKQKFNLDEVEITPIHENVAVESARFALQSVTKNKLRHETLQEFMLVNDSATVAVEVPIVLTAQDLASYKETLGFTIPITLDPGECITGHIDIVQVRNGHIHILDYKPGAKKEKPFEQLMVYALALARRMNLRLYHFKCAWFDDQNYYEFYPLTVVNKKRRRGI
jgi:transposase-like protein